MDDVLKQCLDIQRESKVVLDSIKENDFHGAFEAWKKKMGSLCTFQMRLWQPKLSKLSQHFFFDLVQELSDTPRIRWNAVNSTIK
jgi:hypothetical protein